MADRSTALFAASVVSFALGGGLNAPAQALPWELVPSDEVNSADALQWELVSPAEVICVDEVTSPPLDSTPTAPAPLPPQPTAAEFGPPLQLGFGLPTADRLPEGHSQWRFTQIEADGNGESKGIGNQNYAVRVDLGITEKLMVSVFASYADDPLYATITDKTNPVDNLWRAAGASLRWRLAGDQPVWPQPPSWQLAVDASLEGFKVTSGGSSNMFNVADQSVSTVNVVGSLALPLTWRANNQLSFTVAPGLSVLPDQQGSGQGGAGEFFGTSITLAAGASWRPIPEINFIGSLLMPLGPGNNTFDQNLTYSRTPIYTAGLNLAFNPRIALQGAITNGFGATPATALLTLPSDNRPLFSASFRWNPDGPDTPQVELSQRQLSFSVGGLSVNTGWVPPSGTWQLSGNADSRGNLFGYLGWSASNIFQFDLFNGGVFNDVDPTNTLVNTFANNGGFNSRIGGKLVAFSQLRGAPFTGAGRLSLGRNNDEAFQGYFYGEWMGTWEANDWLAFTVSPKLALSGFGKPWGIGFAANIQINDQLQIIPEANLVASDPDASNGTITLRWVASRSAFFDLYLSTAAGLYDIGTLLNSDQVRVGTRISFLF